MWTQAPKHRAACITSRSDPADIHLIGCRPNVITWRNSSIDFQAHRSVQNGAAGSHQHSMVWINSFQKLFWRMDMKAVGRLTIMGFHFHFTKAQQKNVAGGKNCVFIFCFLLWEKMMEDSWKMLHPWTHQCLHVWKAFKKRACSGGWEWKSLDLF